MQPRYKLYLQTTTEPKNYKFIIWIGEMVVKYNESLGRAKDASIYDHDDFTSFIEKIVNEG